MSDYSNGGGSCFTKGFTLLWVDQINPLLWYSKNLKCSKVEILFMQYSMLLTGALFDWENLFQLSLWLWDTHLWFTLCVPGQTPGGDVEAAGQFRGSSSHSHSSSNAHLAWGQRWIRGKFKGQQSPARATQSPWGEMDCMVHFLHFHKVFLTPSLISLHPSSFPFIPWHVWLINILRVAHV